MLYQPGHDFGMIQFGTEDTSNRLAEMYKGEYQNVKTVRMLSKIDLDFFRDIDMFTASENKVEKGDIMDALIVAMDLLNMHCGTRKYRKRIFLFTDGEKQTMQNDSEMTSLIEQMRQRDVRLNVITLDFANELGQDDEEEDEYQDDEI